MSGSEAKIKTLQSRFERYQNKESDSLITRLGKRARRHFSNDYQSAKSELVSQFRLSDRSAGIVRERLKTFRAGVQSGEKQSNKQASFDTISTATKRRLSDIDEVALYDLLSQELGSDIKVLVYLQLEVTKNFLPSPISTEALQAFKSLERELQPNGACALKLSDEDVAQELKGNLSRIVTMLNGIGVEVSSADVKHAMVDMLGEREWDTVMNRFTLGEGEKRVEARQVSIPACKIGRDLLHRPDAHADIFRRSYDDKGVVAHATKNTEHATNMFVSQLELDFKDGHKTLTVVRHGVNSAYGHKDPVVRKEAAMNRAREVVTAALATKSGLLSRALQGETVPLLVTSSSLLTPDSFRKVVNPKGDEKPMLADQYEAFKELAAQSPVELVVKDDNGIDQTVSVDLRLVSFNFGVNKFAVASRWDKLGGWSSSDKVNRLGIAGLVGDPQARQSLGGFAGHWLANNSDHEHAGLVRELAQQIKEIYRANAHHTLKGGAYKLPARVMVLTSLIGGVPCTNCKSGKDRTSLSVAAAEALFSHIEMHQAIPDWRHISPVESALLKDLCLKGGHHEIQRRNVGVGGFQIQQEILRGYGMSDSDIAMITGLSAAVSS